MIDTAITFQIKDILNIVGVTFAIGAGIWAIKSKGLSNTKDIEITQVINKTSYKALTEEFHKYTQEHKEEHLSLKEDMQKCITKTEFDLHIQGLQKEMNFVKNISQNSLDGIQNIASILGQKKVG